MGKKCVVDEETKEMLEWEWEWGGRGLQWTANSNSHRGSCMTVRVVYSNSYLSVCEVKDWHNFIKVNSSWFTIFPHDGSWPQNTRDLYPGDCMGKTVRYVIY